MQITFEVQFPRFRGEICFLGYFIYHFFYIQYINYFLNTIAPVFVHAGPCMFIHASCMLLMRACARRAYCKKKMPGQFRVKKVWLVKCTVLNYTVVHAVVYNRGLLGMSVSHSRFCVGAGIHHPFVACMTTAVQFCSWPNFWANL